MKLKNTVWTVFQVPTLCGPLLVLKIVLFALQWNEIVTRPQQPTRVLQTLRGRHLYT